MLCQIVIIFGGSINILEQATTQLYFSQHLFLESERRSYFFFCNLGLKTLLEEGFFSQPYSSSYSFFFFLNDEGIAGTEAIA